MPKLKCDKCDDGLQYMNDGSGDFPVTCDKCDGKGFVLIHITLWVSLIIEGCKDVSAWSYKYKDRDISKPIHESDLSVGDMIFSNPSDTWRILFDGKKWVFEYDESVKTVPVDAMIIFERVCYWQLSNELSKGS